MNTKEVMSNIMIDQKAIDNLKNFSPPDEILFGKTLVPAMIRCSFENGKWSDLEMVPYQKILIDPAAKVLHYAQEIFEGLKAYKNDSERVFLFRPFENAKRFNFSATKMGMPQIDENIFIQAIETLVKHSQHFFTTEIGDSFYLRPFMFGDEPQLGVKPSSTYQFYLIGGPAGNYFTKSSVNVRVEDKSHRASAHGIGCAKTGGNYAASMAASLETAKVNYDQTLWLDPTHSEYIEELSGMNFFAIINNELVTPKLTDSILHGITRASLLELANSMNIKTQEKSISINELMDQMDNGECTELFASGTASVLTPISSLMYKGRVAKAQNPNGKLSLELKDKLQKIQTGRTDDPFKWQHEVKPL